MQKTYKTHRGVIESEKPCKSVTYFSFFIFHFPFLVFLNFKFFRLGTWDLGLRTWTWDVGRGTEHGIFSKTKPNSGTKSRNISRVGSNRYKPKNRWRVSPRVSKRQWIDAFKIIQDYIWSFFWKNFFSAYMVVLRLFSEYRVTQTTDCLWSEQRAERETREKTYKRRRHQTDRQRERERESYTAPCDQYHYTPG